MTPEQINESPLFRKFHMVTRARIGILNQDGTVLAIYTHNDGYLEHHGPILLGHYDTEAKVRELLALGALSSLGKKIGKKHNLDDYAARPKDSCSAYHRDRNEELGIDTFTSEAGFCDDREEYGYLFKDGKWFVCHEEQPALIDLRIAMTTEKLTS